jgi:hypothetical protein
MTADRPSATALADHISSKVRKLEKSKLLLMVDIYN